MIELRDFESTIYLLPEDGPLARAVFVGLLKSPGETFISAYGFTEDDLINAIYAADSSGVAVHILLDHTQSCGRTEAPKVKRLAESLKNGDVTITTAGVGSGCPSQIWHDKAMVVRATDGGEDFIWWGSVNFSDSGWDQGNIACLLRSTAFANALVAQVEAHISWARKHEPQYQIPVPAVLVTGPATVEVPPGTAAVVEPAEP